MCYDLKYDRYLFSYHFTPIFCGSFILAGFWREDIYLVTILRLFFTIFMSMEELRDDRVTGNFEKIGE